MSDAKEHILNVALGLFLQKNFKEVTMQEIVEKTGMSKGAFYHYFKSKEQLFEEVINYFTSVFTIDYSKFSKDSLYQFYHDYVEHHAVYSLLQKKIDDSNGFNFIMLIFDAMKLFPTFRDKLIEFSHVIEFKAWEEIVRIARAKGEIDSCMTDGQIARMFVYTSDGVGLHSMIKGSIQDTADETLTLWDSFYQQLKA